MYPDFLTCGRCADEFPLSQIIDFIGHKTSCLQTPTGHVRTEDPVSTQQALSCYFCQQDFHTARGILHHIQYSHHMEIVQQKTPLPSFIDTSQQVTSAPVTPVNPCAADNGLAPRASTISDAHSQGVSDILDEEVGISSVTEASVPVTCAKLASTEGTTICCNGKECQVTINPPKQTSPPPKKCCSSVVPKKRTRHMQEHDSEDMEQCALETLCSLGGQMFISQKCRPTQKRGKKSSKSSRKRKAQCILSCEREVVSVTKASEESEAEAKGEERCQVSEEEVEEEKDGACVDTGSSGSSDSKDSRVEIYSVEKDSITSRKTVIMNSGMTVTVQPTQTAASKKKRNKVTSGQAHISNEDASRESARILAELMYHSVRPVDQSSTVPVQNLQTTSADGQPAPTDDGLQSTLDDPADADLLPLGPNISLADAVNFSNSLCPMFMNPSVPASLEIPANIPGPAGQRQGGADHQPLDLMHLPDLDAMTASIQHLNALDHLSHHSGSLSVPDFDISVANTSSSFSSGEEKVHDGEGRTVTGVKKRRYPTSRPYKCSECEQAFNQPIHLKKHMSKHTGVKPFKCDNCEYSTVERSHLKAHNRIHTGEKPFQCQYCSYATAQNSTLKVHQRRHHQDRQTSTDGGTSSTKDS